MVDFSDAITRCANKYNGDPYDSTTNPGGMDNDGHVFNFIPALQDVAAIGKGVVEQTSLILAAANQQEAWGPSFTTVAGSITFLDATHFTLAGDYTSALPAGKHLTCDCGADGFRYGVITASVLANGVTTITVSLDSGALTSNLKQVKDMDDQTIWLVDFVASVSEVAGYTAQAQTAAGVATEAATAAGLGKTGAEAARDEAANYAAGLHIPPVAAINAGQSLTVKGDGTGYDLGYLRLAGECRLTKNGSNLLLSRLNGRRLIIDDVAQIIPSAGVSLAPTGLTAATNYYIYAAMMAGAMVLEASTTGHSQDPRNGVEVKTGDPTRTLVGMARPIAGPAWTDSATQRFVLSWFNRRGMLLSNAFSTSRSTTSTTLVEINSEVRCEFLSWGDDTVSVSSAVVVQGSLASSVVGSAVRTGSGAQVSAAYANVPGATYDVNLSNNGFYVPSEGYDYITIYGWVSQGTGTWLNGQNLIARIVG